tara:strand:- start:84 stop:542 length:459 start_codon:yes stop_codon:yes gene_type:complete
MNSLESTIQRINEVSATMEAQGLKITPAVVIELSKQAHNEFMKGQRRPAMPDFTEPRFNTEMVVYTIQNSQNRKVYIGKTIRTFCKRYSKGRWWNHTDNNDLKFDLEKYGYANFRVNIYRCDTKAHMDEMEASLISINWATRYNRRPEAEVK